MDYKARCHCGRVRFSFSSPEIKTAVRCNCSLCVRRSAVLSPKYIPAEDFTPHTQLADLSIYVWNDRVLNNYFCKHCGIFVYVEDVESGRKSYRVNLGCVQGLDIFSLEIKIVDGKSLPLNPCTAPIPF